MNFLSHGILYLDNPWVLAGTAVPDWLSVVDRKVRARQRSAMVYLDSPDELLASVARGIYQHHDDDRWFHTTAAFTKLNLEFAVSLRDLLPGDEGFRPTFVGHILIEMILDGLWIRDDASWGTRYYEALASLDVERVVRGVGTIVGQPVESLAIVMGRFAEARFLYDYGHPEGLRFRTNQVLRRVGLVELPESVQGWLSQAIEIVDNHRRSLLTPDGAVCPFPL